MDDRTLPQTIYIVGAQRTGKTTLVNELIEYFRTPKNRMWIEDTPEPSVIEKVARDVPEECEFTASDSTSSPQRALKFQKLILKAQYRAEEAAENKWYISDRSAVDPVVYAKLFVGEDAADEMVRTETWWRLGGNMYRGLVFVCEPNPGCLSDDGVRMMAKGWKESMRLHEAFCQSLGEWGIRFKVLGGTLDAVERRAQVVKSMLYLQRMGDNVTSNRLWVR